MIVCGSSGVKKASDSLDLAESGCGVSDFTVQNRGTLVCRCSNVDVESDMIDLKQINAMSLRFLKKEKMHELIQHKLFEEMKTLSVKRGVWILWKIMVLKN